METAECFSLSTLGLAFGLSMDAFAVAIMASIAVETVTPRRLFRLAFHFGLFQALMPVLGWVAGRSLSTAIEAWDHWIAFGLLLAIGLRSVRDSTKTDASRTPPGDPTRGLTLVALSVATSIDALAVGVTFAVLGIRIVVPVVVIGVVAAAMTTVGMLLGTRLGEAFGKKSQLVGGLVLIGIGTKILLQDLLL